MFFSSLMLGSMGCDELSARRKIQKAAKLYQKGLFDQAGKIYDDVAESGSSADVLEIAYYNGGICYLKMFRPGADTPANNEIARKATEHFAAYLKIHPTDRTIVGLMSQIWMDSGNYEAALGYWHEQHKKNPRDAEVILFMANIHRQAGDWEKAIEWHYKEADVQDSPAAKSNAIMNVAKLIANKLANPTKYVWEERLDLADRGISALTKALALTPENADANQYMGSLYDRRAIAHPSAWAQRIDISNGRYFYKRSAELRRKQNPELFKTPEDKPAADGKAPAADGKAPAADGKAPAADGKAPAADGKAPAADGKAPAADGKAPAAKPAASAPAAAPATAPAKPESPKNPVAIPDSKPPGAKQ